MAKKRKNKGVHVHVHLPQMYAKEAARGFGRGVGAAGVGFLISNPIVAIIIIIVGLVLFMFIGGFTLMAIVSKFMNIWMWCLAILIAVFTKPRDTIVIWAILVGLVFWMYGIYQEMLAWQQVCQIPIIGWLICGTWNMITFLPKLWDLGVTIFVALGMIYICEFIRYQIERR